MVFNWGREGYILERAEQELKKASLTLTTAKTQKDVQKYFFYLMGSMDLVARHIMEKEGHRIESEKNCFAGLNKVILAKNGVKPYIFELYYYLESIISKKMTVYPDKVVINSWKKNNIIPFDEMEFYINELKDVVSKIKPKNK